MSDLAPEDQAKLDAIRKKAKINANKNTTSLVNECPKCKHYEEKEFVVCPSCGLVIEKYFNHGQHDENYFTQPPQTPKRIIKNHTSNQRINEQIADLGAFSEYFTKKEIKYLPKVIREDEIIKGLSSGAIKENTWLIVVTNQRLLFLDKGMIYGLNQMEMDYGQISAIAHEIGALFASITVSSSGGIIKIDNLQKGDAPKVSQLISGLIRESKYPLKKEVTVEKTDVVSQLERLSTLFEKGVLTQDEFQVQKEKILNQ